MYYVIYELPLMHLYYNLLKWATQKMQEGD